MRCVMDNKMKQITTEQIIEMRKALDFTQQQLGDRLGLGRSFWQKYEDKCQDYGLNEQALIALQAMDEERRQASLSICS